MSWNIENSELQKPNELCPEVTLSHLAEHYPHLQACTESLEDWVRAALRDDAELMGLVLPFLGTREELLNYYWGSRRLVRESMMNSMRRSKMTGRLLRATDHSSPNTKTTWRFSLLKQSRSVSAHRARRPILCLAEFFE